VKGCYKKKSNKPKELDSKREKERSIMWCWKEEGS